MATVTEVRHLYMDTDRNCKALGWSQWELSRYKRTVDSSGYAYAGPVTITFEVPDNFDPRPDQIKALEAQREAMRAEFSRRCTEIERQINSLLAIEGATTEVSA